MTDNVSTLVSDSKQCPAVGTKRTGSPGSVSGVPTPHNNPVGPRKLNIVRPIMPPPLPRMPLGRLCRVVEANWAPITNSELEWAISGLRHVDVELPTRTLCACGITTQRPKLRRAVRCTRLAVNLVLIGVIATVAWLWKVVSSVLDKLGLIKFYPATASGQVAAKRDYMAQVYRSLQRTPVKWGKDGQAWRRTIERSLFKMGHK